jgi:hypothetical protein
MKKNAWGVFLFSVIMITATVTHGALAPPPDLSPGDKFHWAFVTQDTTQATTRGISYYNTFVTTQAEVTDSLTEGLGINWYVVGSTIVDSTTVNAKDNVNVTSSVYLLDGTLIANDAEDLWDGSLDNNFDVDQNGASIGQVRVWTGSTSVGELAWYDYGFGDDNVFWGFSNQTDSRWINETNQSSNSYYHLYAISEIQTVVPISSAVWLFGSGLIGIVGIRRKFKK